MNAFWILGTSARCCKRAHSQQSTTCDADEPCSAQEPTETMRSGAAHAVSSEQCLHGQTHARGAAYLWAPGVKVNQEVLVWCVSEHAGGALEKPPVCQGKAVLQSLAQDLYISVIHRAPDIVRVCSLVQMIHAANFEPLFVPELRKAIVLASVVVDHVPHWMSGVIHGRHRLIHLQHQQAASRQLQSTNGHAQGSGLPETHTTAATALHHINGTGTSQDDAIAAVWQRTAQVATNQACKATNQAQLYMCGPTSTLAAESCQSQQGTSNHPTTCLSGCR